MLLLRYLSLSCMLNVSYCKKKKKLNEQKLVETSLELSLTEKIDDLRLFCPFLQDTSSSTSASKNSEADTFDLQKLIELGKRVRKAEAKKQQKSLAKAKKKAQKLEKRRAKKDANKTKGEDNRVQGTQPKRWWQRHLLAMSCITTPCED